MTRRDYLGNVVQPSEETRLLIIQHAVAHPHDPLILSPEQVASLALDFSEDLPGGD